MRNNKKLNKDILNEVCVLAVKFLGCDTCTIWLYDEKQKKLLLRGASERHEPYVDIHYYGEGEGLTWYVFETRKELNLEKCSDLPEIWKGKYIDDVYSDRKKTGGPFLGLPIVHKGNVYGVLVFGSDKQSHIFSDDDNSFAKILSNTLALTLSDNKINFDTALLASLRDIISKLRWNKIQFISELIQAVMSCNTIEEIYNISVSYCKKRLSSTSTSIFMIDKEGSVVIKAHCGLKYKNSKKRSREKLISIINNIDKCPKIKLNNKNSKKNQFICMDCGGLNQMCQLGLKEINDNDLIMPLNVYETNCGFLRVIKEKNIEKNEFEYDVFSEDDKEALITIAGIISLGIASQKKEKRAYSLHRIGELINREDEEDIFNEICEIILTDEECYAECIIRRYDQNTNSLILVGSKHLRDDKDKLRAVSISRGIVGSVFKKGEYEIIDDISVDKRCVFHDWVKNNHFVSSVIFPLKSVDNKYNYGTISILTKFKYVFNSNDIKYINSYISQISNVIQYIREKKELEIIRDIMGYINLANDADGIYKIIDKKISSSIGFDGCKIFEKKDAASEDSDEYYEWISKNKYLIPKKSVLLKALNGDKKIISIPEVNNCEYCADVIHVLHKIQSIVVKEVNYKGIPIYVLFYAYRRENTVFWREYQFDFYDVIYRQIESAIYKIRLIEDIEKENRNRVIASEMVEVISEEDDLIKILSLIINFFSGMFGCDLGYVCVLSKNNKYIKKGIFGYMNISENNMPDLEVGKGGILETVYKTKKPFYWRKGYNVDKEYVPFKGVSIDIQSEVIVPMIYNSIVVGFMTMASEKKHAYSESDMVFIQSIINQITIIIQNKIFYNQNSVLSRNIFREPDLNMICDTIAYMTAEIMRTEVVIVSIIEKDGNVRVLKVIGSSGIKNKKKEINKILYDGLSVSLDTLKKAELIIKNNEIKDNDKNDKIIEMIKNIHSPLSKVEGYIAKKYNFNKIISIPLVDGVEVIGVIDAYITNEYQLFQKEILLIRSMSISAANAIKTAILTMKLKEVNEKILETAHLASPGFMALDYIHDVSHVMGSINAGISKLIDFCDKGEFNKNSYLNIKESLIKEMSYLKKLFKNMVDYATKKKIEMHEIQFKEIIDEVLNFYSVSLELNRIKVKIDKNFERLLIKCDRNLMEQVFINLFNNSIYAIREKKSRQKEIKISFSNEKDSVTIFFKDNGIGIKNENLKLIYDIPYTTRPKFGSGFGLAICKKIVEDVHKGKISTVSEWGKYTVFNITIPK